MGRKFYTFNEMSKEIPELEILRNQPVDAKSAIDIYNIIDKWCENKPLKFITFHYCENGLYVFEEESSVSC